MFVSQKALHIIIGLVLLLALSSLGHLLYTSQQLTSALQSVQVIRRDLSVAQDSLSRVRTELNTLATWLQQRETTLQAIREQVDRIDKQYQADQAHTQQRTQALKAGMKEREIALRQLRKEAQKFSQP